MATLLLLLSFSPPAPIEKLSLDLVARTLYQGKSVTGKGTLYYKVQGGLMVTKMYSPLDQVIFTTATGEYKHYDTRTNTITLMQGLDFSSKQSFIYNFLSGRTEDMGLKSLGYTLSGTRVEEGLIIKTWDAPTNKTVDAKKVETVFENSLPIFMGFYDGEGNAIQKTYYTNYQNVSFLKMPFTITEIAYFSQADSSITQRTYSNLKLNAEVENTWLNFIVPPGAEVVTPQNNSIGPGQ